MRIVKTNTANSMDYVKDNVLYVGTGGGVLIETVDDLRNLPFDYKPGTQAHTAGFKAIWEKAADGSWMNVVGGDDVAVG